MIATFGSLKRGVRNVLRNPIRLVLVVVLLGASLTFTAAMVALNASAQNQISRVRQQVGTGITITPPNSFGSQVAAILTSAQITKATSAAHVIGYTESVSQRYTGTNLYGSAKLPKQFQQFGFQRFGSGTPPGSGTGTRTFPGGRTGGSGSGGGFTFRRHSINTAKGGTIQPTVTGVTGAAAKVTLTGGGTVKIVSGHDLSSSTANSKVALMSRALAKANKLKIGSTFKLNGTKVKLVGLYTTGNSFTDNSIVIPLKVAQKIFKINGITSLTVYVDTAANVNPVAATLQKQLGSNTNVVTQSQNYATTYSALNSTSNNIKSALVASLITAALVIVFAVFIIVRERTREIGVLKAIGASSTNIVTQFTAEVMTLSVSAAVVAAVLLGIFGSQIAKAFDISTTPASSASGFPTPGGGFAGTFAPRLRGLTASPSIATGNLSAGLNAQSLLVILGLAVVLAVVASWIPTWYVSRVRPARVLASA